LRVRRSVQSGGSRRLARQGDQPQPAAHLGPVAGHVRRVAQAGSSKNDSTKKSLHSKVTFVPFFSSSSNKQSLIKK